MNSGNESQEMKIVNDCRSRAQIAHNWSNVTILLIVLTLIAGVFLFYWLPTNERKSESDIFEEKILELRNTLEVIGNRKNDTIPIDWEYFVIGDEF